MLPEPGEEVAIETTITPPPEAGFSSAEPEAQAPRDFEGEARDMGWVPEAEWKGERKPPKFLSAEEFVERGETVIPILKSQLARKDKEWSERLEKIERINDETRRRLVDTHKAEVAQLTNDRRYFAQQGDLASFDAAEAKLAELQKTAPTLDAPAATEDVTKVEATWVKDNDWYGKDEDLTVYAEGYSQKLRKDNPTMSYEENLKRTTARVKDKFPHKFRGAHAHAPVEGGGNPPPKVSSAVARLTAAERAQANKDIASGAYKTLEEWTKVYNS